MEEEELPTGVIVKDMAIVKRNDKISEQQSALALSEGEGTVEQVWVKVLHSQSPQPPSAAHNGRELERRRKVTEKKTMGEENEMPSNEMTAILMDVERHSRGRS